MGEKLIKFKDDELISMMDKGKETKFNEKKGTSLWAKIFKESEGTA